MCSSDLRVRWHNGEGYGAGTINGIKTLNLNDLPPAKTITGSDDSVGRFMGKLPLQNIGLPVDGIADMANLNYLNEPSILFNLRTRFFVTKPYTYTSDICIAVNPYQWLTHLYTDDVRNEYYIFEKNKLEPHVYGMSSSAFNGMKEDGANQSVLVSGESGAGKTETTKHIMSFFTTPEDGSSVRDRKSVV